MAEARGIAAARLLRIATLQAGTAGERHQQDVAQIGMASAGKMRVREADDAAVVVAVAGCPAIGLFAWLDACVRAELDHAERHRGTRVSVAFTTRTNERVDRGIGLVGGGSGRRGRRRPEASIAVAATAIRRRRSSVGIGIWIDSGDSRILAPGLSRRMLQCDCPVSRTGFTLQPGSALCNDMRSALSKGLTTRAISSPSRSSTTVGHSFTLNARPNGLPLPSSIFQCGRSFASTKACNAGCAARNDHTRAHRTPAPASQLRRHLRRGGLVRKVITHERHERYAASAFWMSSSGALVRSLAISPSNRASTSLCSSGRMRPSVVGSAINTRCA